MSQDSKSMNEMERDDVRHDLLVMLIKDNAFHEEFLVTTIEDYLAALVEREKKNDKRLANIAELKERDGKQL